VNRRILVADDDPNIRELLLVNLQAAGYEAAAASHGAEVMEALRGEPPALVILDVMMPCMDGWEVCKRIKDNPGFAGVKVLMLTAKDTERDRLIGRAILNADAYMTKPFELGALMASVRSLLDDARP
jgi:DNA-binding response OmpR family regulator